MNLRTVFILLAIMATQRPGQLQITLPNWSGTGQCVIRDGSSTRAAFPGHEQLLPCPGGSGVISCTYERAEPVDVPLQTVCDTKTIPLRRARSVAVKWPTHAQVTVDWLEIKSDGAEVRVASRTGISGDSTINVADIKGRFVRFLRVGVGPVTVAAEELLSKQPWVLPPSAPGGEILARIPTEVMAPRTYRVTGPAWAGELAPELGAVAAARGVAPGRYEIRPGYEGGVVGRPVFVNVELNRTTVVALKPEDIGGIETTADSTACPDIQSLSLWRVTPAGSTASAAEARRLVMKVPPAPGCSQRIVGLAPGAYDVVATGRGLELSHRVAVSSRAMSPVHFELPALEVSGRVLVNGRAIPDLRVGFESSSPQVPAVSAVVDSAGQYSVRLQEPGEYRASIRIGRFRAPGGERMVRFKRGRNAFDWSVEGGMLEIGIRNWDRSSPITLTIKRVRPSSPDASAEAEFQVATTEDLPVVWEGVPFADYAIQARQRRKTLEFASDQLPVSLTKDKAITSVDLELRLREAVLLLRHPAGGVVEGAKVSTSYGRDLKENQPGVFLLNDLPPGGSMLIQAPGFTPVCKLATSGSTMEVVLDVGTPIQVEFTSSPPTSILEPRGRLLGQGSDCLVSLYRFTYTLIPRADTDSSSKFQFRNFPRGSTFLFVGSPADTIEKAQRVQVGPDGILRLIVPAVK